MVATTVPAKVRLPASLKDATRQLEGIDQLLTAHEWERAAIVYAFTTDQQGKRSDQPQKKVSEVFGIGEFAALGIRGLSSAPTVRRYRQIWASNNKTRKTIKPGEYVVLPKDEFPLSGRSHGIAEALGPNATVEDVTGALVKLSTSEHLEEAIERMPQAAAGTLHDRTKVKVDQGREITPTPRPSMAGSSVTADVVGHFATAAREIERAVERLNQAITAGTKFERFEFESLAMQPEAKLDPELLVYRKTVGMVLTHQDEPA